MCLSDAALEFLIAREVASLLGSRKLIEYGTSGMESTSSFLPPRLASRVACLSLVASLYLAYQVCYVLNRLLCLSTTCLRPFRLLGYTGITVLMLLCQRQLIISWRHNAALALDSAVAKADHDFLVGGIEYYDWKRSWNAFWMRILPSSRRAMKVLRSVTRAALTTELSPLLRYQVQRGLKDPTILYRDPASELTNIPALLIIILVIRFLFCHLSLLLHTRVNRPVRQRFSALKPPTGRLQYCLPLLLPSTRLRR